MSRPSFQPQAPAGFEGLGCAGSVRVSNAQRTWTEAFHLPDILVALLAERDVAARRRPDDWVHLTDADLYLRAEILSFQSHDAGPQVLTAVAMVHPTLFPEGLFEYQHAVGQDLVAALTSGLRGWSQVDLTPMLAAIAGGGELTELRMVLPPPTSLTRRAVLGPVLRHASSAATPPAGSHDPFCPCCLLTNSMLAFHPHLVEDRVFGVRLLVVRDEDGSITADCRVNGRDHAEGQARLIAYGEQWPGTGFEMRKQYVVLCTDRTG